MSSSIENVQFRRLVKQIRTELEVKAILKGADLYPEQTGDEIVIGGWQFDVKAFIYPDAKCEDILSGWDYLCILGIPVDVLSLGLLCLAILEIDDPRIMEEEPELVDLLRLCFWVNKCATLMKTGKLDSSLSYKIDELENEIGQGIKIHLQIHIRFQCSVISLEKMIKYTLRKLIKYYII